MHADDFHTWQPNTTTESHIALISTPQEDALPPLAVLTTVTVFFPNGGRFAKASSSPCSSPLPLQSGGVSATAPEDRLARLEMASGQLMHCISPESRPDLNTGALQQREPHFLASVF